MNDELERGGRPLVRQIETRPIDQVFRSVYADGPFTSCLECDEPFVRGNSAVFYVIMKVLVHDETIIELAMCDACRVRMRAELSTSSQEAIAKLLGDRFHPNATIESCAMCARQREACRSCSIYAHCAGETMIVYQYPFMICDECEERLQDVLSDETRRWQQDFMDRHFSGPSLEVGPKLSPVLI